MGIELKVIDQAVDTSTVAELEIGAINK